MTILKLFILLCAIQCLAPKVLAQSSPTDSLEQTLKTSRNQTKVDLLNQLTYEFITQDNEKVIQYNTQALRLAEQINYKKGEAIAYTYRGVSEYLTGHLEQGHANLNRGLNLSREIGDKTNEGYTLLQLGNCSLEEVENDSAEFFLKAAYEIFKDSTDPTNLSKVYRNMSAVYGQRYQYDKQQHYLDRSIAIRRLLPDKVLLVDALALKANNSLRRRDVENAETILTEAEALTNHRMEFEESRNDFRHLRALILFESGKFDEAAILVDSARDYYLNTNLIRKYVTLLIDISEVFSNRGEYELALNNLYSALKLSKLHNFDSETYTIRTDIGWINFNLGDYTQALQLANEALEAKPKKQLKVDFANALTLKGVTQTETNDFPSAATNLNEALQVYIQLNDNRGKSETFMNLGYLEAKQGHFEKAKSLYYESIALAKTSHYPYGIAWSSWGLGDIYFKQRDFKKAAYHLDQSEHYAYEVEANEILIRSFNTRRDLLAAQNRYKESLVYSIKASDLNDSIHRKDLARRFFNLEKLQEIEQRDHDIMVLQQEKLLAEDQIRLQQAALQQQYILLLAGVIGIMLLGVIALVYYRFYKKIKALNISILEKNNRIQMQADKLAEMNNELSQLYEEVSERNEEILAQSSKLSESNHNITELNRNLERLVADKTLELRTTNDELVRYNNELLQFSYTVSHNLRGPVARILGLSVLAQSEHNTIKIKEWIDLMSNTASDLDLIIKDLSKLLDLRHEPNRYRENVELQTEWNQSISLLKDSFTGQENIESNFEDLPRIVTVRAMIQSIFYNLLSNSIKFRSPKRILTVTAKSRYENGKAIIEIADNGLGFDIDRYGEKLFKLYTRFHTHVEGRGLGLYLIKTQLEVLDGTIEVASELDHGSRFLITIPYNMDVHPQNESVHILQPGSDHS